jgi:hypothetical protein
MESESIRIVHALPGRVRLKAAPVRGNPGLAQQVEGKLRGVAGVREVRANPLTGSILLLLDVAKLLDPEALAPLADVLGELFPEIEALELATRITAGQPEAPSGSPAWSTEGLVSPLSALNSRVGDLTGGLDLRLLVPLTLLYLGLRRLLTDKQAPAPAWYDFLWFGFSTFIMLNRPLVEGWTGAQGPPAPEEPPAPPPPLKASGPASA